MIFNFSDQKHNILNNINNRLNKLSYKSSDSYRAGVLPNIMIDVQSNEVHKKITFKDKIEKLDDYKYRWHFNSDSKTIQNIKQILDLSFNYQYTPIKIEDNFVDFSTEPNKDIFTDYNNTNNKRNSLLIKYDEIDREYYLYPKKNQKNKIKDGRMFDVHEIELIPKYKSNQLFKIEVKTLLDDPLDFHIKDFDKQLIYFIIIKKDNYLLFYKKYFKTYDIIDFKYNEYFQKINESSKYIFESNDFSDELKRMKFINKTKQEIGTLVNELDLQDNNQISIITALDNRWEIKINMLDDNKLKNIKNDFIISIPILNIPSSNEKYPFYTDRPVLHYINGSSDQESNLHIKRDTLKKVTVNQLYDGGVF